MKDCIEAKRHGDEMIYQCGIVDHVWKTEYLVVGGGGTRPRPGIGTG